MADGTPENGRRFQPLFLGDIAESDSSYCDRCYSSVVCPCVCPSVTLVHPAKAVGRNEMPFGRDTRVVPIIRQGPRSPMGRRDLGVETLASSQRCLISLNYFGLCYCFSQRSANCLGDLVTDL